MYLFSCRQCGEYETTQETFYRFCPASERQRVTNALKQQGTAAVIEFRDRCPRCSPASGESPGAVKIRRRKISA